MLTSRVHSLVMAYLFGDFLVETHRNLDVNVEQADSANLGSQWQRAEEVLAQEKNRSLAGRRREKTNTIVAV